MSRRTTILAHYKRGQAGEHVHFLFNRLDLNVGDILHDDAFIVMEVESLLNGSKSVNLSGVLTENENMRLLERRYEVKDVDYLSKSSALDEPPQRICPDVLEDVPT